MRILSRAELKNELIRSGIRPSVQRLAIYEYVHRSTAHPTAEKVYEALRDELGSLSLTTVYNTLKLYADAGLVMMIHIDDNYLRFDGNTQMHAHFRCNECGEIYDLPVEGNSLGHLAGLEGIKVTEAQLYLRGVCKKCLQQNYIS